MRRTQLTPAVSDDNADSPTGAAGRRTRSEAAYGGAVQLKPAGGITPLAHGPAAAGEDPFWFAGGSGAVQLKPAGEEAVADDDAGPTLQPIITAERPDWKGADSSSQSRRS